MRRLPILGSSKKSYWRSLGELQGSASFAASVEREFPEGASELPEGVSRRNFLTLMGAAAALAGLTGCRRPEEKIMPYAHAPEEVVPGNALYFATAMPFAGTAFGLLVESHEGRPTKIEGNPRHLESRGSSSLYAQASVLDLYDPDRSQAPAEKGHPSDWGKAGAALADLANKLKQNGGKGFAVLTEGHRSPTLAAALKDLQTKLPQAKVFRYEALSRQNGRDGAKLAFGKPMEAVRNVAMARVIAAFDSDFLGSEGSTVKHARAFAGTRAFQPTHAHGAHHGEEHEGPSGLSRLYVAESAMSVTGTAADHRLRLKSSAIPGFVFALAHELATTHHVDLGADLVSALGAAKKTDGAKADKWVKALAKDLARAKGQSLLIAGDRQPASVHAVVHLLNVALANVGRTVDFVQAFDETSDGADSIAALAKAISSKQVDTLLVVGGNPVFDAPADTGFAAAFGQLATSIHLATHLDDTGAAATWHLNRAHYLESWDDVRAEDGTASIVQPLIAPMYDGKTGAEVVRALLGDDRKPYDLVRATWAAGPLDVTFEKNWRRWLHEGSIPSSAYPRENPPAQPAAVAAAVKATKPAEAGFEVTFAPDVHAYDGRFANNAWLQELPDPVFKLTWGNAAWMSPSTAKELGVEDGDLVSVSVGSATVTLPAMITPGQADQSVALSVGLGRKTIGKVGEGVGHDVYPLRASTAMGFASAKVSKAGGERIALARTQEHFQMEGRELAREVTVAELAKNPEAVKEMGEEHPPLLSLWYDQPYNGHKWGLAIDLNACIGCGVCMIACQAENNIPVVGRDGVLRTREMHWIRVDRYFEGSSDEPTTMTQPIPCQQCENAPCEQVCPVAATQHSPEGLNDMAYNRCIGTKYCGNNCPYKVRRFNFFNYTKDTPETKKMQYNPDVTVRSRGVMEKCTYCVQRINEAKIAAKREGRTEIPDGTIVTACQQACPSQAIIFGDLADANSRVARKQRDELSYRILEELNVRPRTAYNAKIRNPNPELETA
jgi:MoCo/4Fe-4S cofactor protein with predicted Tat translocation signal